MAIREIAGKEIEFDEEGFMANSDEWDKDVAVVLATDIGIDPLTDRHWQVIDFCRSDYQTQGDAPTFLAWASHRVASRQNKAERTNRVGR